jgi:hypothetical protein
MILSERTIQILKNFSTINPSIVLKPGNRIVTMSPARNLFAEADIEEEIPGDACIYDVSRFLSILSLYDEPNIDFREKEFIIKSGKRRTTYAYAAASMVIAPTKDRLAFPSPDVEMEIKWSDLQAVIKAANILKLQEIVFVGEDGKCYIRAMDSENPTADTFGIELGDTDDEFKLRMKTEFLKLLPDDYVAKLGSQGIACFESKDLKYYVAINSQSTYKKG